MEFYNNHRGLSTICGEFYSLYKNPGSGQQKSHVFVKQAEEGLRHCGDPAPFQSYLAPMAAVQTPFFRPGLFTLQGGKQLHQKEDRKFYKKDVFRAGFLCKNLV